MRHFANREKWYNPAWSETLCTHGSFLHGNREIPPLALDRWYQGPRSESSGSTTAMNEGGKSDSPIDTEEVAEQR